MDMPLIAATNLEVHFPTRDGGHVRAVDGVNFSIQGNSTFGVIGESGSGKSTLGRVIVGLTRPTGGVLLHAGENPFAMRAAQLRLHRRNYQIIFQDPHAALNPRMTIHASVREPLDIIADTAPSQRDTRAHELLELVGLDPAIHTRFPHQLSGGQKQRANIARALTTRPRVLVCDEVVAALDVSVQAGILNLFAELQERFALSYVFITHDLSVATHVSDTIAVMYLGRLVELGPAEEIHARPRHPYTQALLSAEPEPLPVSMRRTDRILLQGDIPSPIAPPTGCRFHTRCWKAESVCRTEQPAWREIAPSSWVACHLVHHG